MKNSVTWGRHLVRLLGVGMVPFLLSAAPHPAEKNKEALAAYEAGEYEEALRVFTDALVDAPDSHELHYNIGVAKYKLERYQEALDEFQSALASAESDLAAKAHYNTGNCLYRQAEQDLVQGRGEDLIKKYEEAVQAYIEALKINPDDVEAKRNIELIRRKIKEMLDRQQQEPQQQQQQQQQQEQEQEQQQSEEEEHTQQQPNQGRGTPTPQQPDETESRQPPEVQPTPVYMTPEEAERLLDSLDKEKREEMEEQLRRARPRAGVEADW